MVVDQPLRGAERLVAGWLEGQDVGETIHAAVDDGAEADVVSACCQCDQVDGVLTCEVLVVGYVFAGCA